ncbi:hypothetical protein HMPREF3218_0201649 [Prevotella bivia]|nr:hypothetical protein HMPREF3218_0201649 [Prevotella bivia]
MVIFITLFEEVIIAEVDVFSLWIKSLNISILRSSVPAILIVGRKWSNTRIMTTKHVSNKGLWMLLFIIYILALVYKKNIFGVIIELLIFIREQNYKKLMNIHIVLL